MPSNVTKLIDVIAGDILAGTDEKPIDEEINTMTPNEVFRRICEWEGLLGYFDEQIRAWIQDIYKIKLKGD